MSTEQPELGEIRTSKELGFNSAYKWMWALCEVCKSGRWVRIAHGKPLSIRHNKCNYVNCKSTRKHRSTPEEIALYNPQIGDTKRGYEIGKPTDTHLYMWHACPDCSMTQWKAVEKGKVVYLRCSKCGKPLGGKSQKGIKRKQRKTYDVAPQIGDVRYAIEAGFSDTGRKYIWHSCVGCGKERWVALTSKDVPQNPKCAVCSKLGTIRAKSLKETRKCSKCHNEYPATSQYFTKATRSYRGISSVCKDCRKIQNKLHARKKRLIAKHRLNAAISGSINSSLREKKNGRHWEALVGYTLEELMEHLESQFADGMTWDNYGRNGWWLDHVVPVAAFSFQSTSNPDFGRCWELKNLQPLWKMDNMLKSDKVDKPFQPALQLQIGERRVLYVTP